jgi:hypothetical protein
MANGAASTSLGAGTTAASIHRAAEKRLSGKGYEQRSEREFGWYTEGEIDWKAPLGGPQRAERYYAYTPQKTSDETASLSDGSENLLKASSNGFQGSGIDSAAPRPEGDALAFSGF